MVDFQVFSRYGKLLTKSSDLLDLIESITPKLIPGTAFEAVWDKNLLLLYVFDVTFYGIGKNSFEVKDVKEDNIKEEIEKNLEKDKPVIYTTSVISYNKNFSLFEETATCQIELVSRIDYYYPIMPFNSDDNSLRLPPDDWVMELKVKGERILTVIQPDKDYLGLDIRGAPYDIRHKIRNNICRRLDNARICNIPTAEYKFPGSFEEWRDYTHAVGVIMKKRNGLYKSSKKKSVLSDNWIKIDYKDKD